MSFNGTPFKSRPPTGQQGSTPSRTASANKFRSSLVPTSRPSPARAKSPTKLTKTATARNLFGSTPRNQSITPFAPDLPAEVTRATPRMRKIARKSVSTDMSNAATSTQLFEITIPTPDPELTGEALAKELPDDPNLAASIHADEFLQHKCPPHFDERQRRQFFAILDLRRLKYTAEETFATKDWSLNISKFARVFERSRMMILMRYGLYGFQTVHPTAEMVRNWKASNGIPEEEGEGSHSSHSGRRTPGPTKSTKRKAENELTQKDNTLTPSTANRNKRRNVAQEAESNVLNESPFKTTKRKAEASEENEMPVNKLAKSTPTAASIFEGILNKPRNGGTSPVKPTIEPSPSGASKTKDSQGKGFAIKANPFQSGNSSSLFGSTKTANSDAPSAPSKPSESVFSSHPVSSQPTTNTGNIFSYLSESPGSSSNDDDAEDHETNSDAGRNSEDQGQSVAASAGTSTPPVLNGSSSFTSTKVGDASNIFGGLSKPSSQAGKGGLFDRVTIGPDAQPVRASPTPDDKQTSVKETPVTSEDQTSTPAKLPGDYTFNPTTTPISFAKPSSGIAKTSVTSTFGSSSQPVKSDIPEPKVPVSIFGQSAQSSSVFKPSTPSLFGSSDATKPKSSDTPVSIFAQKPAPASTSIFGAPSTAAAAGSPFKKPETPNAVSSTPTAKQAVSIFGAPSATTAADSPFKKPEVPNAFSSMPTAKQTVSNFGAPSTPAAADSPFKKPEVPNSFSSMPTAKQTISIFGAPSTPAAADSPFKKTEPSDTVSSTPAAKQAVGIFGAPSTPAAADSPFKKTEAPNAVSSMPTAKQAVSIFGAPSATTAADSPFKKTEPYDTVSSTPAAKLSASIFDKPTNATPSTSETKPADNKKVVDTPAANGQVPNIFDKTFIADNGAKTKALSDNLKSSSDLFSRDANPLFGGGKADGSKSASSKSIFGQASQQDLSEPSPQKQQTANESNKENLGSSFGVKAPVSNPPTGSIFGTQGASTPVVSTSVFGEKKIDSSVKSTPSIFGGSATATNNSVFAFGSQSNTNTQVSSSTFPSATTPNTSISFGAPSSQVSEAGPKKIDFQFGNSGQTAGSASFTFGQDLSAASSFTFTAGASKVVNNPFAASQPSSQASASVFGSNPPTATPSSSFSFTQPASSTPKAEAPPTSQAHGLFGNLGHTNGTSIFGKSTPSLSFTQAPQSQNSSFMGSKTSAPMTIFGHLQTSGEASVDINSSFPAPSSIGTTPLSGTPEPETAQDDDAEAREAQISLTDGRPGEEDEISLHEVRAKAIKYIPVEKDDEDRGKSPWSTQGIGTLRILKNKSTGTVRLLMRTEPRGHIALNKMVISDTEYKAKEKLINFLAAKDDGSGLETWILQTKTPQLANELATVLEANKSANK